MKTITLDPVKLLGYRLAVVEAEANGTVVAMGSKQGQKIGIKEGSKPT